MKYTEHEINAAINEAESVAKPLTRASEPVTITQETLCRLIAAANEYISILHPEPRTW